jgi:hypothetical protein
VKNNSPLFAQEQTYMGDVSSVSYGQRLDQIRVSFLQLEIDLSNLDAEKSSVAWYALQEPNTSAGGILKIKYDQALSDEQNTQL